MRIRKRVGGNIVNLEAADNVATIQGIGFSWIKNMKVIWNYLFLKHFGFRFHWLEER
jgi:hypothetical protein